VAGAAVNGRGAAFAVGLAQPAGDRHAVML
jgi:hypothetical protein